MIKTFVRLFTVFLIGTQAFFAFADPFEGIQKRDMIAVPGGAFKQGKSKYDAFDHKISAFQMGKHEVTYELWSTVFQWAMANGYTFEDAGREGALGTIGQAPTDKKNEPVTYVTWYDVMVWCNAYSEMAGLKPCYAYSGEVMKDARRVNATAGDSVACDWSANGYRLPTEGECWYAASYQDGKKWTPDNFASGATADSNDAAALDIVSWYKMNSGESTRNVGEKKANRLGIHDMTGNVSEWCWNWSARSPKKASIDYRGPESGTHRVVRGGHYQSLSSDLEIGKQGGFKPFVKEFFIGFRVARSGK